VELKTWRLRLSEHGSLSRDLLIHEPGLNLYVLRDGIASG
jgi:hypothetical protein